MARLERFELPALGTGIRCLENKISIFKAKNSCFFCPKNASCRAVAVPTKK